jgi:hypothetical protein
MKSARPVTWTAAAATVLRRSQSPHKWRTRNITAVPCEILGFALYGFFSTAGTAGILIGFVRGFENRITKSGPFTELTAIQQAVLSSGKVQNVSGRSSAQTRENKGALCRSEAPGEGQSSVRNKKQRQRGYPCGDYCNPA